MIERALVNPYVNLPGYNCFGCAPGNAAGLGMQFVETDFGVRSTWEPQAHVTGYPGVVHGGIQATMLDEIASWYVYVKLETAGVTAAMNVTYDRPVRSDAGPITIEATGHEPLEKRTRIFTEIRGADGEVCTRGECDYAVFPEAIARRRMHYPGVEAFYAAGE